MRSWRPAYRVAYLDIQVQYNRSLFGAFWEFADPLVYAAIFIVLGEFRAFGSIDPALPYPVFVVTGVFCFQIFADAVTLSVSSISRHKGTLSEIRIEPEVIVLSTVFRIVFNALPRITIVLIVGAAFGALDSVGVVYFLLILALFALLGLATGIVLAPFNCFYSDIQTAVGVCIRPLMFASGVVFPLPTVGWLNTWMAVNPIGQFVDALRAALIGYDISNQSYLLSAAMWILTGLALGIYVFHVTLDVAAERA